MESRRTRRDCRGRHTCLIGTDALLLAQALESTNAGGKVRVDAITRGAQPAGREEFPDDRGPGTRRRSLPRHPQRVQLAAESIFRRHLPRLTLPCFGANCSAPMSSAKSLSGAKRATCSGSAAGVPQWSRRSRRRFRCGSNRVSVATSTRCVFRRSRCRALRAGEVLIDVKAADDFADVLKALALYPGEAPDARIFGD